MRSLAAPIGLAAALFAVAMFSTLNAASFPPQGGGGGGGGVGHLTCYDHLTVYGIHRKGVRSCGAGGGLTVNDAGDFTGSLKIDVGSEDVDSMELTESSLTFFDQTAVTEYLFDTTIAGVDNPGMYVTRDGTNYMYHYIDDDNDMVWDADGQGVDTNRWNYTNSWAQHGAFQFVGQVEAVNYSVGIARHRRSKCE